MFQLTHTQLKTELIFLFLEFLGVKTPIRIHPLGSEHNREKEERLQRSNDSLKLLTELSRLNKILSFGDSDDYLDLSSINFHLDEAKFRQMREIRELRAKFDFKKFVFPNPLDSERIQFIRYAFLLLTCLLLHTNSTFYFLR